MSYRRRARTLRRLAGAFILAVIAAVIVSALQTAAPHDRYPHRATTQKAS
jgi:hypothetical protein